MPSKTDSENGVEIYKFAEFRVFYGTVEALSASGLCAQFQMPAKRGKWGGGGGSEEPRWASRWHPSGKVVYSRETDEYVARKLREQRAATSGGEQGTARPFVLAPPVVNGTITDAERHHIRLLRTMHSVHRELLFDMAFGLAEDGAKRGETSGRKSHLELVVDNAE